MGRNAASGLCVHAYSSLVKPNCCSAEWIGLLKFECVFSCFRIAQKDLFYPTFIKPATLIVISVLKQCASGGNINSDCVYGVNPITMVHCKENYQNTHKTHPLFILFKIKIDEFYYECY